MASRPLQRMALLRRWSSRAAVRGTIIRCDGAARIEAATAAGRVGQRWDRGNLTVVRPRCPYRDRGVYEVGTALDLDTALFAHPASDANPGRAYSISAPVFAPPLAE